MSSADRDAELLRRAEREFAAAVAARGLVGWIEHFAEDGVQFHGDGSLSAGHAQIEARMRAFFADADRSLSWDPMYARVSLSGDLGYTYGPFRIAQRKAESDEIIASGHYLSVWRRDGHGEWKVAADIGVQKSHE
jgi:ketosteroid isomerase-like protein